MVRPREFVVWRVRQLERQLEKLRIGQRTRSLSKVEAYPQLYCASATARAANQN